MKVVKILDISVDLNLLNLSRIADESGLSLPYISQLLNPRNKRKNKEALQLVHASVIKLYSSIIKRVPEYEHEAA
ncbi:MAG: hypothetical protein KKB34_10405 [Bacteroidetes bacterium]|jgi:hypothetical protein|nr:hypothetical protein [Bacteroidota bacterium]